VRFAKILEADLTGRDRVEIRTLASAQKGRFCPIPLNKSVFK
jgi:hypothetical protein